MERLNFELIVLGAGPAGLSAAQYGARANLKTLLIDEAMAGGQVFNIYEIENYPGVYPGVNGMALSQTMEKQAKEFGVSLVQERVEAIEKIDSQFVLRTSKHEYASPTLIIATGAAHRNLEVPGEKEFAGRGVSYCATCDGPFFRNRKITVVGGGDSACSAASYLATLTDNVTLIHRKPQLRAQKAVAQEVLDNPKINVMFNKKIVEIQGDKRVSALVLEDTVSGEKSVIESDALFIYAGMLPRTEIIEGLERDAGGYLVTNENMETSVPGLYVAGDVRSKYLRQVVTACADGAIAATRAAEYVRIQRNEAYK